MSCSRRCDIVKDTKGQWNLVLGNFEYAYDDSDCTVYGPFKSAEAAEKYLDDNFSNPGAMNEDDSGTRTFPKRVAPQTNAFNNFGSVNWRW